MDDRLTVRERLAALERLETVIRELAGMAAWLSESGADASAVLVEDAVRNLAAAGWILERPVSARVPGRRAEAVAEAIDAARRTG